MRKLWLIFITLFSCIVIMSYGLFLIYKLIQTINYYESKHDTSEAGSQAETQAENSSEESRG